MSDISLADATGRMLRTGKRGQIPTELAPILKRLDIDINRWFATMQGWREFIGGVVGGPAARAAAARAKALASTGKRWFQNRCTLFAEHPQSSPVSRAVA